MNVQFSIAVNPPRRRSDTQDPPATWYRVTAWGELAERIDKLVSQGYIAKGRTLFVEGRLDPRQFTGNDGQVRWSMDVRADAFEFTGSGRDQDGQGGGLQQNQGQAAGGGRQAQGGFDQSQRGRPDDDFGDAASDMDDVPF
jgi:single-strand DNA-binding protein